MTRTQPFHHHDLPLRANAQPARAMLGPRPRPERPPQPRDDNSLRLINLSSNGDCDNEFRTIPCASSSRIQQYRIGGGGEGSLAQRTGGGGGSGGGRPPPKPQGPGPRDPGSKKRMRRDPNPRDPGT